jgi:hypothetical protein
MADPVLTETGEMCKHLVDPPAWTCRNWRVAVAVTYDGGETLPDGGV